MRMKEESALAHLSGFPRVSLSCFSPSVRAADVLFAMTIELDLVAVLTSEFAVFSREKGKADGR